MQGKTILVTGGAGFIGSNLANELAENNDVYAFDNEYLGTADNLSDDVYFFNEDVVTSGVPYDIDVVFHLAALSSYDMHEKSPRNGVRTNVEGFVNIVDEARQTSGCDTVVYASTSSIYGNCTDPTSETASVKSNTAYEASKLARERYGEYYSQTHGMNMAGLRFFSVYQGYGGNEEHKDEYANIISQFADDIYNERSPTIYGDGTQTRDFTHVDDVVNACIMAAENELDGIYNVGTGESYSFNTVVDKLNIQLCRDVKPEYIENPIPESVYVHDTCADPTKIQKEAGWEAEISFDKGIKSVCREMVSS